MIDFCDLLCKYASVPEDDSLDGAGSCMTFNALYCSKKKRLVYKNQPCDKKAEDKDLE